jgi:hypothetical protein
MGRGVCGDDNETGRGLDDLEKRQIRWSCYSELFRYLTAEINGIGKATRQLDELLNSWNGEISIPLLMQEEPPKAFSRVRRRTDNLNKTLT